MKKISHTSQFKRDVKKMKKREKSFDVFKQMIQKLARDEPLDEKVRDHKLIVGTRECHVEPDWLQIYESHGDELVLVRTGTHSDLFG